MPITQSAKKALRQSVTRRARNLVKKDAYKKAVKHFRDLVAEKKTEEAKQFLPTLYQALDKAAKGKIIEKNKADRLKSRLTHLVK
jgi:ribosomal protein S20